MACAEYELFVMEESFIEKKLWMIHGVHSFIFLSPSTRKGSWGIKRTNK